MAHAASGQSVRALRKLFLTLFLRGRSARRLRKDRAPRSLPRLLAFTLLFYGLFGSFALSLVQQPLHVLSTYLHAATFAFVAMFVAASGGEILFNREEADILLHRPVAPSALLQAKMAVLVEVSLWLAGAFNLVGLFIGAFAAGGNWRFPLAHVFSLAMAASFCTGSVVLAYQLCLRWLGRERLEGLMTTVQVFVAMALVLTAQVLPRLAMRFGSAAELPPWWLALPPAWFAAIDDALAGNGDRLSWLLATGAVLSTVAVVWLAAQRLAGYYTGGLQQLTVTSATKPASSTRRWSRLASLPPWSWWLRSGAERTAFVLVFAYMLRNREVKLRLYPGIMPVLVIPFLSLWQGRSSGFAVMFASIFIGMVPMLAISLLRYCEHWQASDIFRVAPLSGPAALSAGLRAAVLTLLSPLILVILLVLAAVLPDRATLLLVLPGLLLLPLFTMIPCLRGEAIPLSQPTEDARSARRGLLMMGIMAGSAVIAGLAYGANRIGRFWEFVAVEALLVAVVYFLMSRAVARAPWPSME